MKEIVPAKFDSKFSKSEKIFENIFEIIHDHRAIALKKRRKLLRQRNQNIKVEPKTEYGEDQENVNVRLNKNMFS